MSKHYSVNIHQVIILVLYLNTSLVCSCSYMYVVICIDVYITFKSLRMSAFFK